jgi:drug/metabolite transporter (DMT)-like permease
MRRIGLVAAVVGLLSAVVGWLWNRLFPGPDANIGAGLLVVLGLPLAGLGVLLIAVSLLARGRHARRKLGR